MKLSNLIEILGRSYKTDGDKEVGLFLDGKELNISEILTFEHNDSMAIFMQKTKKGG